MPPKGVDDGPDQRARQLGKALTDDSDTTVAVEFLDATVQHGTVREGHGIQVNLIGRARHAITTTYNGTLDVHGGGLFAALPNGLGSAAQMALPIRACIDREGGSEDSVTASGPWEGKLVMGAMQLSRGRLESTLESIVAAGDPPFVFELRQHDGSVLGFLPTRASLLKKGLAAPGQRSVRDDGPLADFRRSLLRTCAGYLRWWLVPLLFLAASWLLFLQPATILPHIPQVNTYQN